MATKTNFTVFNPLRALWVVMTMFAIVSCSNNVEESPDTETSKTFETGRFVDSAVMNIDYSTDSHSGKTNANGEFDYLHGESVTFSIGQLILPEVTATSTITPIDMAKAVSNDLDTQAQIAVNIARLLQSLDKDNKPDNGIELDTAHSVDTNFDLTLPDQDFEVFFAASFPNLSIVSPASAVAHFNKTLTAMGLDSTLLTHYLDVANNPGTTEPDTTVVTLTSLPATISNLQGFSESVTLTGGLLKLVTFDASVAQNYASLSLYSGDSMLVDNIDIPEAGSHTLEVLVEFPHLGEQTLSFVGRSTDITLSSVTIAGVAQQTASFKDISSEIGLVTEDTLKYGGPAIGDVNDDGYYDFVLSNHNYVPPQLVTNNGDNTVTVQRLFPNSLDFHGSSLADYDNDGDLDILVALGGANGTSPTSYALLKNNDGTFVNVAVESGINTPARGRAPRWSDFDSDGDLDIMLANAKTPDDTGSIQLFYRNMGDGTFTPVRVAGVESQNSERLLMTDINGDQIDDLVMYSPLTVWTGNGDFTFNNITSTYLPEKYQNTWGINAITDVDVNNDGTLDLYLAFGKTHYQLSNQSIDFNPMNGELNVHDNGETGTTLIEFSAGGEITLSDLGLTYRQWNGDFPIFLGKDKSRHVVKADGFQPNQLPVEMLDADESLVIKQADASGWADSRTVNGLYIGYIGDGQWQAEWVRDQNIYWNISFTLTSLTDLNYEWTPNNRNGQDVLLINDGEKFVDATESWNLPKGGDHWGVTHGDFNNDGWNDLFVYRYGFLKSRIADLLLINTGQNSFVTTHMHGATDVNDKGHGDMGQAFDFDKDGAVDILSGSEEGGHWYLWKNKVKNDNHYLLVDVGYSPLFNVDSAAATIVVTFDSGETIKKRVASAGEVFSAGVIDTVHFGLGLKTNVTSVTVTWRNGEAVTLDSITADSIISTDGAQNPIPVAINLGENEIKLRQGAELTLAPTFTPPNALSDITWASNNPDIAGVDPQGVVTGIALGDAEITVTSTLDPQVNTTILIRVGDFETIHVTDIEIIGDAQPFYVGQQTQLDSVLTPVDADDMDVSWLSSNESVATIDNSGLVTNVTDGISTITVTALGSAAETLVNDSVDIEIETFYSQSIGFDDETKYKADLPVDIPLDVTVAFHAGSGQVVSDDGIRFYIRELNSGWTPLNDIIIDDLSAVGLESGNISVTFDLSELPLTTEIDDGNFYFLFVKFNNDKGESVDKGLWPLQLVSQ